MSQVPHRLVNYFRLSTKYSLPNRNCLRQQVITHRFSSSASDKNIHGEIDKNLAPSNQAKEVLIKTFPNHFRDGQFVSRMSYVEFIDEALDRADELGLEKDREFYKELLKIFPPEKFHPPDKYIFGLFHAPQQLAVMRVFQKMNKNGVTVDKDFEKIVISAFSKKSDAWLLAARNNYWSMKFRNIDENPLPETLPKEPHKLAKLGISRMTTDHKSIIIVINTSKVPDSVDKTWIVSSQSPTQQSIIDRLNEKSTLYIENGGLTFVGSQYLSYFVLKYYVDEATAKFKKEPPKSQNPNYNMMKMAFYGKPIEDKLTSLVDSHYSDGSYTLAIGATGTSSQDSLLSWLKILQKRNPKLGKLNVVFKMSRVSPEIVKYTDDGVRQ